MEKLKLLLVDDHEIFLDGLASLLSTEKTIEIIGRANSGHAALDLLHEMQPDILITDLSMPGMNGIELVKQVKFQYPDIKILVLSMHRDREIISEIMMVEAEGYVLKNTDKQELVKALHRIAHGSTFYSNEVMSIILERIKIEKQEVEVGVSLTDREKEILHLIAEENSNEEIAEKLFISRRTVETHRKNMLRKAEVNSVIGLLKYGVRAGLIDLK